MPSLPKFYIYAAGAALLGLFVLSRKGVAEALARGAVGVAEGAVVGTVKGVGDLVGIPDTDADQCTLDLARGDLVAASFSCPAKRWADVAVLQNKDAAAEALKADRGGYILNPKERN